MMQDRAARTAHLAAATHGAPGWATTCVGGWVRRSSSRRRRTSCASGARELRHDGCMALLASSMRRTPRQPGAQWRPLALAALVIALSATKGTDNCSKGIDNCVNGHLARVVLHCVCVTFALPTGRADVFQPAAVCCVCAGPYPKGIRLAAAVNTR
jgi:hypothetical protein